MRRMLVFAVVVLATAGLAFTSLGTSGAAVDDGYFDRWIVTSVSYDGTTMFVSYTREWVHPPTGTIVGSFSRVTPTPSALVLTPAWNSPLSGQTGGPQGLMLGTSTPSAILVPGTYLLTREIRLDDGTPTYRQDVVITLAPDGRGGAQATWTSTEELFVPQDPTVDPGGGVPTPVQVPNAVPAGPQTTG